MKSIIEEASSIVKAIEKAWTRAGSPREFSVKIFEDSQKSFFGLTTKQAKVGVFFEIESGSSSEMARQPQASRDEVRQKKQPIHSHTAERKNLSNYSSAQASAESTVREPI